MAKRKFSDDVMDLRKFLVVEKKRANVFCVTEFLVIIL